MGVGPKHLLKKKLLFTVYEYLTYMSACVTTCMSSSQEQQKMVRDTAELELLRAESSYFAKGSKYSYLLNRLSSPALASLTSSQMMSIAPDHSLRTSALTII